MNLKAQLPNFITLLNLLSGVMGIIWVLEGELLYGAYFVLLSATFDFFDGFAARLLKVQSDMGKELDSLAEFPLAYCQESSCIPSPRRKLILNFFLSFA